MEVLFLEAPFNGDVKLCSATLNYLKKKKYNTVALYASVQFCNNLDHVQQQLQDAKITIITSQADRTHVKSQLLGCDNYHTSLNLSEKELQDLDAYLYIGDGKFHPLALAYGQKETKIKKEVVCNDPLSNHCTILSQKEIEKVLKRYKGSLLKFLSAHNVGVLVTIKPGQEQLKPSYFLEKNFPLKKFYYFIDNIISFDQLENFNFIEVWVNSACPRIGLDDQQQFRRGVINLNDALHAEEILSADHL